jgi:hypothetical protein
VLLLIGYFACGRAVWDFGRRMFGFATPWTPARVVLGGNRPWTRENTGLLLACYLATSCAVVSMGGRFLTGYFLLWLPFIVVAGGFGLAWLCRDSLAGSDRVCLFVVVVVALGGFEYLLMHPLVLACLLAGTAAVTWGEAQIRGWSWQLTRWLQWLLIVMIPANLVADLPHIFYAANVLRVARDVHMPEPATRVFFAQEARSGDRLYVWGNRAEFYSVTGLEPATKSVVFGGATGSFFEPTGVSESWAAQTMAELKQRQPRFIVTGRAGSTKFGGDGTFAVERWPALGELLRAEYQLKGRFIDCDVYERRELAAK